MRPSRRRQLPLLVTFGAAAAAVFTQAPAVGLQRHDGHGTVVIPDSSMEKPGDKGETAHTLLRYWQLTKPETLIKNTEAGQPPYAGYFFETPASAACIYRLVPNPPAGCDPNAVTTPASGGSEAIAIVDAYDYPTAAADLAAFSTQFWLPQANFHVVYANGGPPKFNAGWAVEESLDIEWAHAMAPGATIYLVEAKSASFRALFSAVSKASQLVRANGGGEVSMSFSGSEFSGESGLDSVFFTPGVVYVAAAGDSAGVGYPSASPYVVSAGGTTIDRDPVTGEFLAQGVWQSTGGGPSAYEPRPAYQDALAAKFGTARGTPDLSFDADPSTGVWVYNSSVKTAKSDPLFPWLVVGGTSVAAPAVAGIINAAGHFAESSQAELTTLYANAGNTTEFTPITNGNCGPYGGYLNNLGSPYCTGIGVPNGLGGK